jgi:vWA domain found in the FtsH ternary systems/N-terminal helical region fused to the FtsH ternary system vWA domain
MNLELRDPEALQAWLGAGLCLTRLQRPEAQSLGRAAAWVRAALSDAPALPPPGVLADVGWLLERGGQLTAPEGLEVAAPGLRRAMRAYEDHLLGRLAADRRFEAAADAVARLDASLRAEAVALLVDQVLRRIGFDGAVAVTPAAARRVLGRPAAELLALGLAEVRRLEASEGDTGALLAAGYERLAARTRHASVLLTDQDVFTLENLDVLRRLTQRVAIQQMVDAAEQLERTLPRRMRRRPRRRGVTATRIEDENTYPAGGFSSISTSGSMENLVCSELIYMEDGDDFDLFDVRYSENELLYYTRDDSVFLRNHRAITILLHPDLTRARFKDAELPWQRLVLLFGLLLCTVRRLIEWLDDEALRFDLRFVSDRSRGAERDPLAAERELCALLLREWVDKGVVSVDVVDPAQAAALRGTELILVELHGAPPPEHNLPAPRRPVVLEVSGPLPRVSGPFPAGPPPRGGAWQAWTAAARALLSQLL